VDGSRATLVLGLGNPLLGDDGVGWTVAEEVRHRLAAADGAPGVEVDCVALGGIGLMERMLGYERAVLVDAVCSGKQPVGSVGHRRLEELEDPSAGHTTSPHDVSLQTALSLGRRLGASVPRSVVVVTVETGPARRFSERLSARVAAAVPRAAADVLAALCAAS